MKTYHAILAGLLFISPAMAQDTGWQTDYEKSGRTETPRYAETMAFCRRLDAASPMVTLTSFGISPQGRELPLLIVDRDGLTDPTAIRKTGRIILLIQACIHAGECEGKDAGLMLVRDLVHPTPGPSPSRGGVWGGVNDGMPDHVTILFIPIFNVDGHERFGPYNRFNQNGPTEMGWRTTAANLNLNRDFLKADAPEMQAWLRMFNRWMPDFFIDSHTTDGADYQYVLTYLMEVFGDMDEGLTAWSKNTFIPGMEEHMKLKGMPVFPYVEFRRWHDPRSGLISEVAPPMLSQGYTALRNRPGLLIETHMLKPYPQRVDATYECMLATLEILNRECKSLSLLIRRADEYCSGDEFLNTPFPLRFETGEDDSTMVNFLGVEYHTVQSDLSGGDWFQYGTAPETFAIPYFSSAKPTVAVKLPSAYIIPAEWSQVIERLKVHGITMTLLKKEKTVTVTTCRFKNPKWQQNPYEGRHPVANIEFDGIEQTRSFPAGSALIDVKQPAGRIIPHILEPNGNGSYLYWGFFDAIFEQKEYGETYKLENVARKMLAEDPALKEEFERKKDSDSTFARDPWLILNWFYGRSAWADPRRSVYPVGKIYDMKVVGSLKQ